MGSSWSNLTRFPSHNSQMQFHMESSRSSPTQAHSHIFPSHILLDAASHRLILKQSYMDSFSYISKWSFTWTHPKASLTRLLLIYFQMQFHTDSFRSSPTQAPSHIFPNEVSHWLILKQPYPGSISWISKHDSTRVHSSMAFRIKSTKDLF